MKKLRKILRKINNFFPEVVRIISQFFETEYFYRLRKITYHDWFEGEHIKSTARALEHLNNTWDGDIAILNILDDKIFHMYVNLRKYGSTLKRYIHGEDMLKNGTKTEKAWGFYRSLDKEYSFDLTTDVQAKNGIKREVQMFYVTDSPTEENVSYYFAKVKDTYKLEDEVDEFYSIAKCTSTPRGETRTAYVWDSGSDDFVAKEEPLYKKHYEFLENLEKPGSLKAIIDYFKNKLSIKITEKDLYIEVINNAIEVYPEDYLHLSDKMKGYICGRIKSLHTLWQFRRMLDTLYKMSDEDEPYASEYNEALKEPDLEKRKELAEQAWNHFKKDRKEYAHKVADFWCDNSGSWWD